MPYNLEGWYIDPENNRQFRYCNGEELTKVTSRNLNEVRVPLGLLGKKFTDVRPDMIPLSLGFISIVAFLFWAFIGIFIGLAGLVAGVRYMRIQRIGLLIAGIIMSATGCIACLGFVIFA